MASKRARTGRRLLPAVLLPAALALCGLTACGDGGAGAPPERVQDAATSALDVTRFVPCDVATWFLYDPEDLAHRRTAPSLWWMHEFALGAELQAARMVAVGTGSDGNFGVRFTDTGLTDRETFYARGPAARFPLRVTRGRLFLGNGDALPSEDPLEDPYADDEGWIDVPVGDYTVDVHAIAWADEPGAVDEAGRSTERALTAFVAVFAPTDDLAAVPRHAFIPRMDGGPRDADRDHAPRARAEPVAGGTFPVFVSDAAVYPGSELELPVDAALLHTAKEADTWALLVARSADPGTPAALFRFHMWDTSDGISVATGHATCFVRLASVEEREGTTWAHAAPPHARPVAVPGERIDALKSAFAAHAASDDSYRERTRHPRFAAERIAALDDASRVAFGIAALLELDAAERAALVDAVDAPARMDVVERALAARADRTR